MEEIKRLICTGYWIVWVGYHSHMKVRVHLFNGHSKQKLIAELDEDYTKSFFRRVLSSAATEPGAVTGTIWRSDSRLELLRLASILGINIGGSCEPGCGQEFKSPLGCIMGYDIETDRSRLPLSSFGTLSETITSIAIYCSCGHNNVFSLMADVNFNYVKCTDSKDTVSKFMQAVQSHSPQWLVGYNNFSYDNTRIAYHSDENLQNMLVPMKLGSGSSLSYAYYIDIEGTYNADLLTFLDKTRRSAYPNMSLATLVSIHTSERKIDFDTADVSDFARLFEYNIHDCKITVELAIKSGALTEITSLCSVACVPVIDSVRFVTGTFAACSVASYCLKNEICMDWSPCLEVEEYKGAEVLKPVVGLHDNVVSCDFSSMYPTILIGSNISIENISATDSNLRNGSTWKSQSGSNFVIDGRRIGFNKSPDAIIPPVMKLFVDRRRLVRKSNPSYALGLKIAANSIYGSLGDRNSKIYSPMCSASVTTGGRWCLAVAETIIKVYGFKVVYGDTDSCYVTSMSKARCSIAEVLKIMKAIFSHTPFPGMSMELEDTFTKIAFLGKKTYFGMNTSGKIISKGMSKSRKDRIGVSRTLASHIVETLLSDAERITMTEIIADMMSSIIDLTVQRRLRLSDVSKYVKKGGSNYFEYKSSQGSRELLECETYTGNEVVDYSIKEVCILVCKEIKLLLNVSSLGSLSFVMKQSSII